MEKNENYFKEYELTCPYCTYDMEDYSSDDCIDLSMCTPHEVECSSCEKKFWATSSLVYDGQMDCKLNGEKHNWVPDKGLFDNYFWHDCTNCAKKKVFKDRKTEIFQEY